jgi:hypothetical protein
MDASEFTRGQYVTADELGDVTRPALIHNVRAELVGRERPENKLVLELVANTGQAWPRDLVLNRTNTRVLIDSYGKDTTDWTGKPITVSTAPTRNPQGQPVRGIVVTVAKPPSAGSGAIPLGIPSDNSASSGNGSTTPAQTATMAGNAPGWSAPETSLDDEIPF